MSTNGNAPTLENDTKIRDITVIGAGPVGLITSFWAGMREASSRIIDSLPDVGGQLTTLYPEKWIFDVPGYTRVLAKDLVEELRKQSVEQFEVPVHLEVTAERVEYEPDPEDPDKQILRLVTDRGDLLSRAIIIAGGHGAFEPKKLPGYDMDPWEGKGAHYLVGEKAAFAGKKVIIVGGGDSACDWVLNLLDTASEITLVHRREGFRAHEVTVNEIMQAAEAGKVDLRVPYQIKHIEGNGGIERVTLFHSENEEDVVEVDCDAVLLQLGFKTALGPLKEWPLEVEKGAIVVDPVMKTSMEGVWAAGDITTFDGKLKLIATGFAEAAVAVAQAVHHIRPDTKIQPKYSTNTGLTAATHANSWSVEVSILMLSAAASGARMPSQSFR
jgi:ferredoxin/flavodoxin---NADP+ reductase